MINKIVKKEHGNYAENWKKIYDDFEMVYGIDLKLEVMIYNKMYAKKLSRLDYVDVVLKKLPALYNIAVEEFKNRYDNFV